MQEVNRSDIPLTARKPDIASEDLLSTARRALFERLNPQQRAAVFSGSESSLVLAGAGSGKTSVLTARIARLVADALVPAGAILAVTFTNKAAQEMRERLCGLLDRQTARDVAMGTFHSLCNRFLRENHKAAGLPKSFVILDTDDQETLCRDLLKDLGLTKSAVKALRAASTEHDEDDEVQELVTAKECVRYINGRKETLERPQTVSSKVSHTSPPAEQLNAVYEGYEERLRAGGLVDFQDLLTRAVEMLKRSPLVREAYRTRFRAILVDEFQDTNALQYELLQLLKGPKCHIMAVGDDSQSIYSFRGAEVQFMSRFVKSITATPEHPNGRVFKLEENYRSLGHIVSAANALIAHNPSQLPKTLFTSRPGNGERIKVITHSSGMAEASHVAKEIHRLVRTGSASPADIAVIYRTNTLSRLVEQELNRLGIPLTVYGGQRFFQRAEIRNVLAYLELIGDITHDIAFVRVANFPPRDLGDRTVEALRQDAQQRRLSMMETVGERSRELQRDAKAYGNATARKKQAAFENFASLIMDLVDYAQGHTLSQVTAQLLDQAGITSHFEQEAASGKDSQDEARDRLSHIHELVSAARQFELDRPELKLAKDQLPEYLSHVALMTSTSEASMEQKQTVSLMTAHSSKGLEFKYVFIVGTEEGVFPHGRALGSDADARSQGKADDEGLQEERRLMYVAITRAREELTISHALERMVNGTPKPCEVSRFIGELPSELVEEIERNPDRAKQGRHGNSEYGGDAYDATRESPSRGSHTSRISTSPLPVPEPATPVRREKRGPTTAASAGNTKPLATKVAIIGTVGRDRPTDMSRALWAVMLSDASRRVRPTDHLVCDGTPWAAHLAVHMYLGGFVANLTLHLAAPISADGFIGHHGKTAAAALNHYHHRFAAATGCSPFQDIMTAKARGAVITSQPVGEGFDALARCGEMIASEARSVIAYTWATGGQPQSSAALDVWNKVAGPREHVDIEALHKLTITPSLGPTEFDMVNGGLGLRRSSRIAATLR